MLVAREQDRPEKRVDHFASRLSSTRPGPKTNWTKTNMIRFYM
jgi:hypothetical protein